MSSASAPAAGLTPLLRRSVTPALWAAGLTCTILVTAALMGRWSELAPLVLAAAAGFFALCVSRPGWALVVVALLVPLEAFQLPLGTALGALSPARGALLVVAAGYATRALLWPGRVSWPSLRDSASIALLLALLPSLLLGVGPLTVAKVAVNWTAYVVASIAVRELSGRELRRLVVAFGVGAALLAGQGVLAYVQGGGAHLSNGGAAVYGRAAAGLTDPNYYGGLLLLMLVPLLGVLIAERSVWRPVWAVLTGVAAAGLLLSLSRGATLALLLSVAFIVAAWPHARRLVAGVAVVVLLLSSLGLNPLLRSQQAQIVSERLSSVRTASSNNSRPLLWRTSLEVIQQHPEGVGALGFVDVAEQRGLTEEGEPLEHAHNIYLNLAVELGVAGLVAFLALCAQVGWVLIREVRRRRPATRGLAVALLAAFGGYLLQGMTVTLYAVQIIQAMFFLLVGMALALPGLPDDAESSTTAVPEPARG